MSVEIKYKGNTIASASTQATKTIKTSGKYCEADIEVINTPDGGGAPVINPLSVTENGTYNAPSGVDGYSPVTVNVPQGVFPTGKINITDTSETDVTNYAKAQVVDANLVAANIKKDVNILGILGSFEGGGGGSLPSVISKIDGGSFTLAADTLSNNYTISHNLGEIPKGFAVYAVENLVTPTVARVVNKMFYDGDDGVLRQFLSTGGARFDGLSNTTAIISATDFRVNVAQNYYEGGCTYNWFAWV